MRRHFNHQARFSAIFCRWPAGNRFERLNRVQGNLVGKDLALLVCNGLAIHGKRILRVIAQSVKQSVRVRHYSGRRQRYQGTDRRRLAFQRHPVRQRGVYVRMKAGIFLDEILSLGFHRNALYFCANFKADLQRCRHGGPHVHVL